MLARACFEWRMFSPASAPRAGRASQHRATDWDKRGAVQLRFLEVGGRGKVATKRSGDGSACRDISAVQTACRKWPSGVPVVGCFGDDEASGGGHVSAADIRSGSSQPALLSWFISSAPSVGAVLAVAMPCGRYCRTIRGWWSFWCRGGVGGGLTAEGVDEEGEQDQ